MGLAKYFLFTILCLYLSFELNQAKHGHDEVSYPWVFRPIGMFSASLLRNMIGNENNMREQLYLNKDEDLLDLSYEMIKNAMSDQISVILWFAIGCILTFLSSFTVVLLYFWSLRAESTQQPVPRLITKKKSILLAKLNVAKRISLTLGIFISVAFVVTGSVLVIVGSQNMKDTNDQIFDMMSLTVNGTYIVKHALVENVGQIPPQINKVMMINLKKVFSITEYLMAKFVNSTAKMTDPLIHFSGDVEKSFSHLFKSSLRHVKNFEQLSIISKKIARYVDILSTLVPDVLGRDNSTSENITKYTINKTAEQIRNISAILELLMGIQRRERNFFNEQDNYWYTKAVLKSSWAVTNLPSGLNIDPVKVSNDFREIATKVRDKKYEDAANVVQLLEWLLPTDTQSRILKNVENNRNRINFIFERIYPVFPAIAIVALSVVFPITIATILGLIGTNFFARCSSEGYSRNLLSNSGGNILESGLYTASFFVWMFWCMSVILYIISIGPTVIYNSLESMSITDVPVSLLVQNNNSLNSHLVSNITLKDILNKCKSHRSLMETFNLPDIYKVKSSYFDVPNKNFSIQEKTINDLLFDILPINTAVIKHNLALEIPKIRDSLHVKLQTLKHIDQQLYDMKSKLEFIEKDVVNYLNYRNYSPSALRNLSDLFDDMTSYRTQMAEIVRVLIKKHFEYDKEQFDRLVDGLNTINDQSEKLNQFIENDIKNILLRDIESVANRMIEGFLYGMQYAVKHLEDNDCVSILSIYKRITACVGEWYLETVAIVWFGVLLISIFLLTTIIASIPVAGMFKLPSKKEGMLSSYRSPALQNLEVYNPAQRRRAAFNTVLSTFEREDQMRRIEASVRNRVTVAKVDEETHFLDASNFREYI